MFIVHNKRIRRLFQLGRQVGLGTLACLCLGDPSLSWSMDVEATPASPAFSLHGFGTLGMVRTDEDKAQFIRDQSQPSGAGTQWATKVDSLLGIQANVQFGPSTEAVVQAVTRYHADGSYSPELVWAFLRHDFSPGFSLRAGRLGTEFYMLGDSRLVGYSNISVRPSPDFYDSLVFSYIDGMDISATRPVASGLLKGKLFAGQSPEKVPYAPAILWDLDGSNLVGGYLDYSQGPWQIRMSHAQVRFNNEAPVDPLLQALGIHLGRPYLSLAPEMSMAGKLASFNSLGLVYDQGPLNVQFMLNQITHESQFYLGSRASYVLVAYGLGAVMPYVGMSRSLSDAVPTGLDPVTEHLVAHSYTDQHTYTLGGRWDFRKNMALKGQVDWLRGKPASVFLFKGAESGDWSGKMTVFSLALDFVF
jgi:hypothetical protein